jgi:hypothetical protein
MSMRYQVALDVVCTSGSIDRGDCQRLSAGKRNPRALETRDIRVGTHLDTTFVTTTNTASSLSAVRTVWIFYHIYVPARGQKWQLFEIPMPIITCISAQSRHVRHLGLVGYLQVVVHLFVAHARAARVGGQTPPRYLSRCIRCHRMCFSVDGQRGDFQT